MRTLATTCLMGVLGLSQTLVASPSSLLRQTLVLKDPSIQEGEEGGIRVPSFGLVQPWHLGVAQSNGDGSHSNKTKL